MVSVHSTITQNQDGTALFHGTQAFLLDSNDGRRHAFRSLAGREKHRDRNGLELLFPKLLQLGEFRVKE